MDHKGGGRLLSRKNVLLTILVILIIIAILIYVRDKSYYNCLWQGIGISHNSNSTVKEAIKCYGEIKKIKPNYTGFNRDRNFKDELLNKFITYNDTLRCK